MMSQDMRLGKSATQLEKVTQMVTSRLHIACLSISQENYGNDDDYQDKQENNPQNITTDKISLHIQAGHFS